MITLLVVIMLIKTDPFRSSKISKLQSMVESLFFYVYYFDLVAIGSTFFIVFSEQFSFMHIVIATTVVVISLECYVLCSLIESLKDTVSNHES